MAASERLAAVSIAALAFLAGLLPCLMTVGPALFADGPMSERFVVMFIGVVAMLALGALGGAVAPRRYRLIGAWLAAPTVPIIMFFGSSGELQGEFLLLAAAFVVSYFAAALFAAWLTARIRLKPRGDASAPR